MVFAHAYIDCSGMSSDPSGIAITLPLNSPGNNTLGFCMHTLDTEVTTLLTTSAKASVNGSRTTTSQLVLTDSDSFIPYSGNTNASGIFKISFQYRAA